MKRACEEIFRKGAGLGNFIWLDSQDIAAIWKDALRAVTVWILGVQREVHEVKRTLAHVPIDNPKPKPSQIMQLEIGQFYVTHGRQLKLVYVQPSWMTEHQASLVATGKYMGIIKPPKREEEDMGEIERLREENKQLRDRIAELEKSVSATKPAYLQQPDVIALPTVAPQGNSHSVFSGSVPDESPVMSLTKGMPEIDVTVRRYTLTLSDEDDMGRIAQMLTEGFFDNPKKIEHINSEFRARGWLAGTGRPRPQNLNMAKLAEQGFIRIVGTGSYQSVPGMKVRIMEVEVA